MNNDGIVACTLKKGKVTLNYSLIQLSEIQQSDTASELVHIWKECLDNNQAAWYYPMERKRKNIIGVEISTSGKTLREQLVEGYKYRYDDDLKLASELNSIEDPIDDNSC